MEESMAVTTGDKNSILRTALRSAMLAFVLSLAFVLIFAFIVKLTNINGTMIGIVNQVIKILSAFLGVLFGVKDRNKWLIKGVLGGALFAVLAFLVFSILGSGFNFMTLLTDVAISAVAGIVGALISAGKN